MQMKGRSLVVLYATLAILGLSSAVRAQSASVVHIDAGDISGVSHDGVFVFRGIPYASPPAGDLRWREPQAVAPWKGIRKAEVNGNACIQPPGLSAANGGDPGPLSEDCLYLNVWTPKLDHSAKLPVMVWIHGGAYIFGSGGLDIYDGGPLARRGAVFVSFNYRLGQLGFFMHPGLEKENPGGPANFGLLDQIAALQWIKRNIAEFGGDPGNVTILGQSAGAKSVMALFASPLARGLFHKGVAMSQYAIPDVTRAKALEVGSKVATELGLGGASATAAELRAVPAERFAALKGTGLSNSPVPISGDKVLPHSIQETFEAGDEAPAPLILGDTSDDASVVVAFGLDPAKVIQGLRSAGIFLKMLYPGVRDDKILGRQVMRDVVFTMPVRWVADRHSKRAPTWRYYFDYTAVKDRQKFPHGVPHGSEIVYMLDTGDIYPDTKRIFTPADREYAQRVSEYLFQFAHSGTPAAPGGPVWPSSGARQDRTMVFGKAMAAQANFMKARMSTFLGLSKIVGSMLQGR
jgi:para-nitrobenzyl esterase